MNNYNSTTQEAYAYVYNSIKCGICETNKDVTNFKPNSSVCIRCESKMFRISEMEKVMHMSGQKMCDYLVTIHSDEYKEKNVLISCPSLFSIEDVLEIANKACLKTIGVSDVHVSKISKHEISELDGCIPSSTCFFHNENKLFKSLCFSIMSNTLHKIS